MKLRHFGLLLFASSLTAVALGAAQPDAPSERFTRGRIAAHSPLLEQVYRPGWSEDEVNRERDRVTSDIRTEVTRFIELAVSPSQTPQAVQTRLQAVLADHVPERGLSDRPTVRRSNLRFGDSLVVNYTVVRPPHHDSSLLFGFRADAGRFQLVATIGEEFEGHGMFTIELPSPMPGEMWLLVGGRAFTFNGAKYQFRVYSFDGNAFNTVWTPDSDFFRAEVRATAKGFAITHDLREIEQVVTEEYAATGGGIIRIK